MCCPPRAVGVRLQNPPANGVAIIHKALPICRFLWLLLLILFSGRAVLHAGTTAPMPAANRATDDLDLYRHGRWEFSLDSAYVFASVPTPFFYLLGRIEQNPVDYHLATQVLGVRYRLTDAGGPWLLRGSLQMSASVVGSAIVAGPESYFVGFALGFRYDFVQPGARLVPYLEIRGGPGVTDSRGYRYAQQQDFTFTYLLGAGFRYDVNRRWSVNVGALEQHLSNAYLTIPNYGFDSLGFNVGVLRRF